MQLDRQFYGVPRRESVEQSMNRTSSFNKQNSLLGALLEPKDPGSTLNNPFDRMGSGLRQPSIPTIDAIKAIRAGQIDLNASPMPAREISINVSKIEIPSDQAAAPDQNSVSVYAQSVNLPKAQNAPFSNKINMSRENNSQATRQPQECNKKSKVVETLASSDRVSEHSEISDSSSKSSEPNQKKRGRKMTELAKYFHESDSKIREWKSKLKNDKTLTAKDKQKYRNKISAQISRVKKKQEVDELVNAGSKLKLQMFRLTQVLDEELKGEVRTRVMERVRHILEETSGKGKSGNKGNSR